MKIAFCCRLFCIRYTTYTLFIAICEISYPLGDEESVVQSVLQSAAVTVIVFSVATFATVGVHVVTGVVIKKK